MHPVGRIDPPPEAVRCAGALTGHQSIRCKLGVFLSLSGLARCTGRGNRENRGRLLRPPGLET